MAGIAESVTASDIAVVLAEMKATAAYQRITLEKSTKSSYILGCDQILTCDDNIYGKPKNIDEAQTQLFALGGKTHQLLTAAVLLKNGQRIWHHLSTANMTMRHLDKKFIDRYLRQLGNKALSSPGSYQIEAIGVQLFSKIKGCHYGILGMPLLELLDILRLHGLEPGESEFSSKNGIGS